MPTENQVKLKKLKRLASMDSPAKLFEEFEKLDETTAKLEQKDQELEAKITEQETILNTHIEGVEQTLSQLNEDKAPTSELEALQATLEDKIKAVELTPGPKGDKGEIGARGDQGIAGEPGKDGESIVGLPGKDGSPDTRLQIVEKINAGEKKDLKIELDQIETGVLEKGILDRAISILDQRTKFLINKGVKHDDTLSGSGTDADPLKVIGGGASTLDELTDVVITTVAKNQHLIFNGTNWVNAADGTTFTLSCTAFDDGLTTGILAGSGVWKADEAISFTASYDNGPPTSADVKMSINGGAYNDVGNMDAPNYTTGKNYDGAINYPTVDQYLRFRLESSDGTDSDIDYAVALYFYNYIFYGASTTGSGFSEANVEVLTSTISSSYTTSRSINAGANNYVVWAYPSRYTSIHATGAIFNSVTMPFTAPETVAITNSAGLQENYKVFASTTTALGNSTLQLSTSSTTIDPIYYGVSTVASGYTEANVEGLATSVISNTKGRTISVTAGANQYIIYALPLRLGTVTFTVDGFSGGFQSPETVSITNVNGYTENYYVYRSTNHSLGTVPIVIT